MISGLDSESGGPGFESRSGHLVDLFSVLSSSAIQLINSQLVASSVPVGVFNPVMLYLNYSFLSI